MLFGIWRSCYMLTLFCYCMNSENATWEVSSVNFLQHFKFREVHLLRQNISILFWLLYLILFLRLFRCFLCCFCHDYGNRNKILLLVYACCTASVCIYMYLGIKQTNKSKQNNTALFQTQMQLPMFLPLMRSLLRVLWVVLSMRLKMQTLLWVFFGFLLFCFLILVSILLTFLNNIVCGHLHFLVLAVFC